VSEKIEFILDGDTIQAEPGQTIMQAADAAGRYIPRLCAHKDLPPHGSCRVCTVLVNGKAQSACTQPVANGIMVESDTAKVRQLRTNLIEMLFVEGNHYCMFCEKSGNCELQALAYRFGIAAPKYPYQFPHRDLDATHPDIFLDRNRCVLCARCVRASKTIDGKNVFQFVGRGRNKRIAVDARAGLGETDAAVTDRAIAVCPVGAILRKRVGYAVPIGKRLYDIEPIGTEIEKAAAAK
jgi:[NiFe] hydrogenase diaphorase moiety small subunit